VKVRRNGVSKSASFLLKAQATAWAAVTEADILAGKYSGVVDKTFGDVLVRYRDEVSIKKAGSNKEDIRINRLLQEPFAAKKLSELSDADFVEWRDRLMRGTAERRAIIGESVLRYMHIINPAIKLAIKEWKWLKENPLNNVTRPQKSKPRDRRPTLDELDKLCFVMGYERDRPVPLVKQRVAAAMLFAVETGCRAKDLTTMKRSSVNFELRTSRVEWDTKTGERDIALTTEACRIIKQVIASIEAETVFGITPAVIDGNFRKYKKQAMVEGLTFHDMKHEACTRLAKYMKIEDLARNVGTRDLRTLMLYYNPTAAEIAVNLP
jgi:integrase